MPYTDIKLDVTCDNCGAEIGEVCRVIHGEEELPSINIMQFECESFHCNDSL